ncbi:Bug family tripartite tricarboxylate transporter substrate binding protein [Falsiroseomonas sp. HW251]|uniref:Bug family tripartite tricarboxylate transporter substrate binding protein n=1 Tax=Falsiroseomonas sp. HW251 TaxID=3390998 RepID=UPI003D3151B4
MHRRSLLSAGALAALPRVARAQAFPARAIRFLVPFGAGTATDNTARFIGARITEATGQPVVVDNRPGGNGVIGVMAAKAAPADGYTVMITGMTTQIGNPELIPNLPYDPVADFAPLTTLGRGAMVLLVRPAGPHGSVADLVAAGRQAPGRLTFASASLTSRGAAEVLNAETGIAAVNVSYRASPAALTDLIGGQVDFAFTETLTAMPLVRSGTLRALGVSQPQRVAGLGDVPTFDEAGIPGLRLAVWNAAYAPAATPPAILDRLNALLTDALRRPETEAFFARDGFQPMPLDSAAFARFQAEEHVQWAAIIRRAGITLD